jgi:hypothetical protein
MDNYYNSLNNILKKSEYNNLINENDNLDNINNFQNDIKNILLNTRFVNNTYFHKSYMLLLLKNYINNYDNNNNKQLSNVSGNCNILITNIKNNNNEDEKIFIKFVSVLSQIGNTIQTDLLLFDIITGIIFNYLFENDIHGILIKNHISIYKFNFLSYTTSDNIWNYNEIIDTTINNSPYNYNNILNNISNYISEQYLYISEVIDEGLSIENAFRNYYINVNNDINKTIIKNILNNSYEFYNFLIYIGINYGFIHNDLHLNNILFNKKTNKLVLIDYGRTTFGYYCINNNEYINNIVKTQISKLNYNIKADNYLNLYFKNKLYPFKIPFIRNVKNNKYFGIIYDLITYILNIYIKTIIYLWYEENIFFTQVFQPLFYSIIKINNRDINDLINYNISINTCENEEVLYNNYIYVYNELNKIENQNLKNFYIHILDGLLYSGLLILFKGYKNNLINIQSNELFYKRFQCRDMMIFDFYQYIENFIKNHKDIIKINNFLSNFYNDEIKTGGKNIETNRKTSNFINKSNNKSNNKKNELYNKLLNNNIFNMKKENMIINNSLNDNKILNNYINIYKENENIKEPINEIISNYKLDDKYINNIEKLISSLNIKKTKSIKKLKKYNSI